MQEVLDTLRSPLWWFSVIVAGLLVNLAAAYLKAPIDNLVARYSEMRRKRLAEATASFTRTAGRWAQRADAPMVLRLEKLEHIQEQRVLLLWALLTMFFSARFSAAGWHFTSSLFSVAVLLCTVAAIWRDHRAQEMARLLREVEKMRAGAEPADATLDSGQP
jgi:hypothetical protein